MGIRLRQRRRCCGLGKQSSLSSRVSDGHSGSSMRSWLHWRLAPDTFL